MRKTTSVSEKNPEIPGEEQTNRAVAYVDGSYNQNNGKCGWGVVFFDGDAEPEFFSGFVYGGSWNVSGEIYAALEAVRKALNYGCSDITIFYDYTGIANWVTGAWGTKKPETRAYAEEMHRLMEFIPVHFSHVKAHTGNKWNEKADELAKSGSEIEKIKQTSGKKKEEEENGRSTCGRNQQSVQEGNGAVLRVRPSVLPGFCQLKDVRFR